MTSSILDTTTTDRCLDQNGARIPRIATCGTESVEQKVADGNIR